MVKKSEIIKETNKLKGLKLRTAGRAAGMVWLGFGEMISITRRGKTEEGPEFALHIQCAWRLSTESEIVVASQDLLFPVRTGRKKRKTLTGISRGTIASMNE